MTRINCIPVSELVDKHLLAEYRELPRVFKLARHTENPQHYTLGKGHVMFFYDKLLYCVNRQKALVREMRKRGFQPQFDPEDLWHYHEKAGGSKPDSLWNDWEPTIRDMTINRQRIKERLNAKKLPPGKYTISLSKKELNRIAWCYEVGAVSEVYHTLETRIKELVVKHGK